MWCEDDIDYDGHWYEKGESSNLSSEEDEDYEQKQPIGFLMKDIL